MADKARTTSRRAMLGGIAALSAAAAVAAPTIAAPAATSVSPPLTDFDIAYARYNALARAAELDTKSGSLKVAYADFAATKARLIKDHGGRIAMPVAAKREWEAGWDRMEQVELDHRRKFLEPRWAAAEVVLATPAPSAAALLKKLEVALDEGEEEKKVIAFVSADLRRLAA